MSRKRDINRLKLRLQRFNVTDFILRQKANTQWKPYLTTNVRFCLYHLNYTLGRGGVKLPDYITNSHSIVSLDKDSSKRLYKDHVCAFRCLAVHRWHFQDRLEPIPKLYFPVGSTIWVWKTETSIQIQKIFWGLQLTDIPEMFRCQCQHLSTKRRRRSSIHHQGHLSLQRHLTFEFIRKSFVLHQQSTGLHQKISVGCDHYFPRLDNMKRHKKICKGQTKYRFPGGFYSTFDKLEQYDIR